MADSPKETALAESEPGFPLGILLVVALAFAPVVGFGFVRWDDPLHVLDNPLIRDPSRHGLVEHLTTPALGYPTPLTVLSYRLEYAAVGLEGPWLFHLTNLLLHLGVCALVYRLARLVGASGFASRMAMLVFGLHPVVAEPVAWISGRKDLLSLALSLGCLVLLLSSRPQDPVRRFVAFVCFVLALASKPVSAFVALLVPLVELYRSTSVSASRAVAVGDIRARTPVRWRHVLVRSLPYAAVAAAIVALSMAGQRRVGAVSAADPWPTLLREAWYALGHHLGLLVFVHEPTAKYMPTPWPAPFTPLVDGMPMVFALGLAGLFAYLDPGRRRIAVCALAFGIASYLPSSNLIPLVRYLADSYLHGPLVGFGLLVGLALDRLLERLGPPRARRETFTLALSGGLSVLMLIPSEMRFHDSVSLWRHTFERNPHDYRLCQNLMLAHYDTDGPAAVLAEGEACIARFGPGISIRTARSRSFASGVSTRPRRGCSGLLAGRRAIRPSPTTCGRSRPCALGHGPESAGCA